MPEMLTVRQAYTAMYAYLEHLYGLTKSDDLGGFLGGMSFLPDGATADPAAWDDWLNAVKRAKAGDVNADLRIDST